MKLATVIAAAAKVLNAGPKCLFFLAILSIET
jgi:hypothetical protein